MSRIHIYQAKIVEVIDGDTFKLMIDVGLEGFTKRKMRLYGIDAPEMRTQAGKDLAWALAMEYPLERHVVVQTIDGPKSQQFRDKYGRFLAVIYDVWPKTFEAITNGQKVIPVAPLSLNARLINNGLVKERYW